MKKIISILMGITLVFALCSCSNANTANTEAPAGTENDKVCTLTIECKSVLDNRDMLKDGHEAYVPDDGYILKDCTVAYQKGDTAYDVLKRGCENEGIKLTTKSSDFGMYVGGINNLDELDCGNQSGWLYNVNGEDATVGCSDYTVTPGDAVTFTYVCTY